jgi:hypothetical protein
MNEEKLRVIELNSLVAEVKLELLRARNLHPVENRTPLEWLAIIGEEYGKAQKAAVQTLFEPDKGATWLDHRSELVQTAATILRAILSLDSYTLNAPKQPQQPQEPRRSIIADYEPPECVVCTGPIGEREAFTQRELATLCQMHYQQYIDCIQHQSTATAVHPSGCVLCPSPVTHIPARTSYEYLTTAEIQSLCIHHVRVYEDACVRQQRSSRGWDRHE